MKLAVLTSLALMLPAPGQAADCPDVADARVGITLTQLYGELEVFQVVSPELTLYSFHLYDEHNLSLTLARGIYFLDRYRTAASGDGGRAIYDYGIPPSAMPDPVPGLVWSAPVKRRMDGGEVAEETLTYTFGEVIDGGIGPCRYAMIPVEFRASAPGERDFVENWIYLPELGFAYVRDVPSDDGGRYEFLQSSIGRVTDLDLMQN